MNYYNENDPFAAGWLKTLIHRGEIADGYVDDRDIRDVRPGDLDGFTQCHFFAGVGGWSLALRLAGWPDDKPVWTGSCPCQPFSQAGQRKGESDDRHLWPAWALLIAECEPAAVFGEQVASADGRAWFGAVRTDLETLAYRVGAADLCAAGVGAPHIRQRLYFGATRLGDANNAGPQGRQRGRDGADERAARAPGVACGLAYPAKPGWGAQPLRESETHGRTAPEPRRLLPIGWAGCEWVQCSDGKARPIEPGSFPLAHGIPARVGRLRGYGNAIVPPLAAQFVSAFSECI